MKTQNNNMQEAAMNVADTQMSQNANPYYDNANNTPNSTQHHLAQNPQATNDSPSLFGSIDSSEFIKGALLGAAAGYLLTNEKAQKAIFKTIAKGTSMLQMGMEEMRERFEDAKAEMESK